MGFFVWIIEVNNKTHPRFGTYHLEKPHVEVIIVVISTQEVVSLRWYFDPYNIGFSDPTTNE